jgi:hypothetical protein
MAVAIIFVALFASAFGMYYLFITARNRERMGLIEKGADPSYFTFPREPVARKQKPGNSSVKFTLKSGMLIIGTGVGFILSFLLYRGTYTPGYNDYMEGMSPLLIIGTVFVCGGLGLVAGFYMGRAIDRKDRIKETDRKQ